MDRVRDRLRLVHSFLPVGYALAFKVATLAMFPSTSAYKLVRSVTGSNVGENIVVMWVGWVGGCKKIEKRVV